MFFLIVLLCFSSVNIQVAEQKESFSLSLEQAVEMAWQRNPALQSLAQEVNSTLAQTMIDTSLPDSEIGLEAVGLRVLNTQTIEKEYSFGLSQYLLFPGKLRLKNKIGLTNQEEARLKLEQEKIRLATEVKKAYYLCLFHQKVVGTWEKNLKLLDDLQESAISLYAVGKVSYEDVLRIKIEKARARNELFQARRDLNTSLLELQRLLGLKAEAEIKLTSPLAYQPLAGTPEELVEKARLSSPALKLAARQRERAELLVQLADKSKLPDFVLGFYAPSRRFGAVGFSAGITYPLFSRKKIAGERRLAEAERQKASYYYESVARFFESRKKQALENILSAEQQVKIFSDQLLGETENLLTKAQADFRLGRMDSLNLLDIFRQAGLVNLEYHRAVYFYLTSLAEFESAGEDYS